MRAERPRDRVPWAVRVTAAVLVFLGVSAIPSGLFMLIRGTDGFPAEWVDAFPVIDSLVAPGLVLLLGFGVGSLVMAAAVVLKPTRPGLRPVVRWTGRHWAWLGSVLLGMGHVVWIGLQLVYLDERSWLQPLYGGVGLALTLLPWLPSVRRYLALHE